MHLVIDISVVASFLLLALGLERLLLRAQQRRRIQGFFEEFTVKADDLSPTTVVAQLGAGETIRLLAFVSYFWFCAIIIVTLTISGIITKSFAVPTASRDMHLARGFVCGISLMLFSRWPVPQLLALATSRPSCKRVTIIAVVVFYGGSTILLAAMLLAQWFIFGHASITPLTKAGPWTVSSLFELAFWPAYVLMWLLVAPLTLASLAFVRPALARRAIQVFAGSLWRVVEYEKGALSGLVLLAAFVLGVLKLLYAR